MDALGRMPTRSQACPACGRRAVPPCGPPSASILIVGDYPGDQEYDKGYPFAGPAGTVLRREMARVGLDMATMRRANLWLHTPNRENSCYRAGRDLILDEAKGRKAILLLGSDACAAFTHFSVHKINGLPLDPQDHIFSCDVVMAVLSPAAVFKGRSGSRGVGEFRFGIRGFADFLKQKGVIKDEE